RDGLTPVGREGDREDLALVAAERPPLLARVEVPEPDRSVRAPRDGSLAVARERDASREVRVALEPAKLVPARDVPEDERARRAGREGEPAVVGEGDGARPLGRAREGAQVEAGRDVPELEPPAAPRERDLPVLRQCHAPDRVRVLPLVAAEHAEEPRRGGR